MDLLDCACDIPYEDEDKPHFFEDTRQIQCPMCLASTPPWDSRDQAIAAWNAMQQAMRAQDAQPVETMTVHIPVVLYRITADGAPRVKVPWFHPSKEGGLHQIGVIAQGELGDTAKRGGVIAANAHVITATLPVPQPLRVVTAIAETVGVARVGQSVTHQGEDGEPATWTGRIGAQDGGGHD